MAQWTGMSISEQSTA